MFELVAIIALLGKSEEYNALQSRLSLLDYEIAFSRGAERAAYNMRRERVYAEVIAFEFACVRAFQTQIGVLDDDLEDVPRRVQHYDLSMSKKHNGRKPMLLKHRRATTRHM